MGRSWICLGLVIFTLAVSSVSHAATIRVPSEQPTIQAGVDAASAGDTVLVAPGTYSGVGNRGISFHGRDIVLCSEEGAEATVILCGSPGMLRGFAFRDGETAAAIVDGFTISYCGSGDGGGMHFEVSSPTIRNCIFHNNEAEGSGGAFRSLWSSPSFIDCHFEGNYASSGSVGMCEGGSLSLTGCTFVQNWPGWGTIMAYGTDVVLDHCTFKSHWGRGEPAISLGGSLLQVEGCTFSDYTGGGILAHASTVIAARSIFAFSSQGAAIVCTGTPSDVQLTCCDIYGNTGGDWVGCIADQLGINGNISLDPLFCNAPANDFTLDAASPCAPENSAGCDLIGAWPVGCGTTGVGPASVSPARPRLTIRPNPIVSSAEFVLDREESATLEIYDPVGRLVEKLGVSGSVSWTPGRSLRSGVYFARLQDAGESQVVRFIVLR